MSPNSSIKFRNHINWIEAFLVPLVISTIKSHHYSFFQHPYFGYIHYPTRLPTIFDKIAFTSIILSGPSNWEQWYEYILATMLRQIYKYFKPNMFAILDKPVATTKLADQSALEGVETSQMQKACLDRNQRQNDMYYKRYNIHKNEKKD